MQTAREPEDNALVDLEEYPQGTARHLSWGALRFIKAPPVRAFQWVLGFILICGIACAILSNYVMLDVDVEAPGEIDLDRGVLEVKATAEGSIQQILKKAGQVVKEGDPMAVISGRNHVVLAPVDGTVAKVYLKENSFVPSGQVVATVVPKDARYVSVIRIRSRDIAKIRNGMKVQYKIEAFPNQHFGLFNGNVENIEGVRETDSGIVGDSFLVRGSLDYPDSLSPELKSQIRFFAGMKFIAHIIIERKSIREILQARIFGRL